MIIWHLLFSKNIRSTNPQLFYSSKASKYLFYQSQEYFHFILCGILLLWSCIKRLNEETVSVLFCFYFSESKDIHVLRFSKQDTELIIISPLSLSSCGLYFSVWAFKMTMIFPNFPLCPQHSVSCLAFLVFLLTALLVWILCSPLSVLYLSQTLHVAGTHLLLPSFLNSRISYLA